MIVAVGVTSKKHLKYMTTQEHKVKEHLLRYIPEAAADYVIPMFRHQPVLIEITQERKTIHGCFRPANYRNPHRISVNGTLSEYAFFLVLLHEIAHFKVWIQYGRVKPHGQEWKNEFRKILLEAIHIFPKSLQDAVIQLAHKGNAQPNADPVLSKLFSKNDTEGISLSELYNGDKFFTSDGKLFQRIEQKRTRIKCLCYNDKRYYMFQPYAIVRKQEE